MGYQALLFCPDEKTARTVTQVLGELDFTVVPCTEPFAAVKKLMGEHFDAVVVDCDNEQNATLLFKSARNATNNQSSLAVAVVEGQAGVAKAFRIGANLVLTKPINVEQAKGTLRVARGLLRKGEAAKPSTPAASSIVKPEAPAPLPPKAAPQLVVPKPITARPVPIAPLVTAATASIPTQKPAMQPSVVASVPTELTESAAEPFEATVEEVTAQLIAKPAAQTSDPKTFAAISSPAKAEPKIEIAASQPAAPIGLGGSAASAPAPAREPKPIVSTENQASTIIPKPESTVEAVAADANSASSSSIEAPAAPTPEFTFGGNLSSGAKSAGGGSKKALLAVAAVVLLAAGGYEAWMQWGRINATTTVPARVAVQPAVTPAAVPQPAPSAAAIAPSSDATSVASVPSTSSVPSSTAATQPAGSPTITSDKLPVSVVAANKAPATSAVAQPIVIKSGHARTAAKTSAPTTDEAAPSMTGIPVAANGGPIPNLMSSQSKAPTPVLQAMSISQGVSRGLLVKTVQPSYPASALRLRIEGPVELMATISKNGNISAVKILKGDASLAHAAAEAVKQWKYKPYLLNGEPVEIQTQVTVNFKLPR
jgi:protein TonB